MGRRVSFDVTNFIHTKDKGSLVEIKIEELIYLLEVVLNQNDFVFKNKLYIQKQRLVMRSPLSLIPAYIFKNSIENNYILSDTNKNTRVYWYGYVD